MENNQYPYTQNSTYPIRKTKTEEYARKDKNGLKEKNIGIKKIKVLEKIGIMKCSVDNI